MSCGLSFQFAFRPVRSALREVDSRRRNGILSALVREGAVARTIVSCLGLGLAAATATAGVAGLGASTSPEVIAAAATLGGVAGNFLTELLKVLHRPVAERLLDGRSGIDENHHVVAALRLAQLSTLRIVLGRFDTVWPSDRDDARHQAAERFSHALKTFLDTETASAEKAGFDAEPEQAADERHIRDAVLTKLPDVFDESLAARRAAGNNAALLESLAQLRSAVERAILAEICLRTATLDEGLPTAFVWVFEGSGSPDSWFDLFVRDAAFRLKQEADFERIWNAEQLALVKAIADAHTGILTAIDRRTQGIERGQAEQTGALDEFRALIDRLTADLSLSNTEKMALAVDLSKVKAELNGTIELVSGFLETMVGRRVPPDQFSSNSLPHRRRLANGWRADRCFVCLPQSHTAASGSENGGAECAPGRSAGYSNEGAGGD